MLSGRLLAGLALLLAACGGQPQPVALPAPDPAAADGAVDWFGPGIIARRRDDSELTLALLRPAHVAIMRLDDAGLLALVRSDSLPAGRHRLEVARETQRLSYQLQPAAAGTAGVELDANRRAEEDFRRCRAVEAAQARRSSQASSCVRIVRTPPARPAIQAARVDLRPDILIIAVADVPISPGQFEQRMAAVRGFDVTTLAHDLPEYLVGDRTAMWAGYVVRRE